MKKISIVTAEDADELQRFAAEELRYYLQRLFGIFAEIGGTGPDGSDTCFYLGLVSASHIQDASPSLPHLSDQGHLLRRLDENTMILAGGNSAAVAWAVYELGEQFGVRYLLHGDMFPEQAGPFHLPDLDLVLEPTLKLRSWRQFNDLPTGPAMWSLAQQEAFIRQIFKLKFNSIYLCMWPQHPFVDYKVKGIRRQSGCLLFGQNIPIDDDTIGREHLPDAPFLNNPDMLGAVTFNEKLEAGQRLADGVLRQAKCFEMHTSIHIQPLEFPTEFRPLLQTPTEEGIQLGSLTCAERGDLMNPDHVGLIGAIISACLERWGQVDEIHLGMPEHPHADSQFEQCWQGLDERYGLEKDFPLAETLNRAKRNYLVPGGLERADREFKSAISMLHFFDRFFADNDLLERAAAQNVAIHLNLGGNTEALFPLLGRVLWEGGGISTSMGYTSSRAVRSMHCMEGLDTSRVPAALIITLQDDNIGWLPQMATENIHLLMQNMQRLGWRGFLTRYWPIGDLDPPAACMARASWDASVTPKTAYLDHFTHVYGGDAAGELCDVMRILEDATVILDLDFLSLFFPVLGIMCRSFRATAPMPEGLFHVRAMYEEAQRMLARVEEKVRSEAGRAELAYWQARLEFAVQALIEKDRVHEAGIRIHAAHEAGSPEAKAGYLAEVEQFYQLAVEAGEKAIRAMASQVRDDSDRSSLAAYYHFFVREVREKAAEVLAGKESVEVKKDPM